VTQSRSIAGNAALTIVFQAISVIATLILGIGVARVLGPWGRGAFTYATVSLGMLLTFSQGVSNAVIAQYKTDGLPGVIVYRAMMRILVWASLVLCGITALCALIIPGQKIFLAVALVLPCAFYVSAACAFLIADGYVQRANMISCINAVALTIIALPLLLLFHASIALVLGAWVLSYAIAAFLTFVWTRTYARGAVEEAALRETTRGQLRFASTSFAVFLVSYLNTRIDLFIVGALRGPIALGWYSLAIAVGELLWRWSQALNWAAFSRLAGDAMEESAALAARLTRTILILQGLCVAVLFAIVPWLIPVVYGKAFVASVAVLQMLLPGILAYSLEASLGFFIMVKLKQPMVNLVLQISSTVVCATLTLFLLPRYGLVGAAFATSVTYTVVTIVSAVYFLRAVGLPASQLLFVRREDIVGLMRKPKTGSVRGVNGSEA
jgi:O-antigen/teichoic acid export membrane protein